MGAGVIAVAPFEPLPPGDTIRITNSAVELDSVPGPLDYYPQVVMRSLENASDRLGEYLTAPFPVVTAVVESQYDSLADLVAAVEDGDAVEIVDAVIRAIAQPVTNLVKVVGSGQPFEMAASLIVRLALPIVSGVIAAGSTVVDVVESLLDLDVVGAVSAATNLPARILDGFLNGRADAVSDEYFGFLAPVTEEPVRDQLTGPVSFLIESLQGIGDTIAAPGPIGDEADVPALGAAPATPSIEPEPDSPAPSTAPSSSDDTPPEPKSVDRESEEPPDPEESSEDEATDPGPAESDDEAAPASAEATPGEAKPGDSTQDAGRDPSAGSAAADE